MSTQTVAPERVHTERHGHVLLIRMNRPRKRNAIDAEMTEALDAALNELEDDPELRCGVLSGGPASFCAGTDLATGPGAPTERGGRYGIVARQRRTPLIAAIEGHALGGGMEIALACDIIVAGRTARFGLPEVTHGVVANCGALFRGHHGLPLNIVKQMLLTGRPISAEQAHHYGLANQLAADGDTEQAALVVAQQISDNAPIAVQASLAAVEAYVRQFDDVGWELSDAADREVRASADLQEGVSAFLEKRSPRWQAR